MHRAVPVLSLLLVACSSPTGPSHHAPAGAIRHTPSAWYRTWWEETEACSGLTGRFDAVKWYVVPGVTSFSHPAGDGRQLTGLAAGQHIYLAEGYMQHPLVVRHEMLHVLLRRGGHPEPYFTDLCKLTWESWTYDSTDDYYRDSLEAVGAVASASKTMAVPLFLDDDP